MQTFLKNSTHCKIHLNLAKVFRKSISNGWRQITNPKLPPKFTFGRVPQVFLYCILINGYSILLAKCYRKMHTLWPVRVRFDPVIVLVYRREVSPRVLGIRPALCSSHPTPSVPFAYDQSKTNQRRTGDKHMYRVEKQQENNYLDTKDVSLARSIVSVSENAIVTTEQRRARRTTNESTLTLNRTARRVSSGLVTYGLCAVVLYC